MGNGATFLAAYTWSKNLGTSNGQVGGQAQNAHDTKAQYGYVDPDYRHRFVASYTYELPFRKRGRKYGSTLNRGVDLIAGGWQTSGIVSLREPAKLTRHSFPMTQRIRERGGRGPIAFTTLMTSLTI